MVIGTISYIALTQIEALQSTKVALSATVPYLYSSFFMNHTNGSLQQVGELMMVLFAVPVFLANVAMVASVPSVVVVNVCSASAQLRLPLFFPFT